MPINNIASQPGDIAAVKVLAAYRPIVFLVNAHRTDVDPVPPVVYCDIYFNGIYYKTQSSTQYKSISAAFTTWEFDISDAAQEFLNRKIAVNGSSGIQSHPLSVTACFCRFRASTYDQNNFLQWEGIAPVQGTGSNPPVAGTGTESESFYILNAVLQHEDNPNLIAHLQFARHNAGYEPNTYPLTHRPNSYRLCKTDSDYFPFIHLGNKLFKRICITYRLTGQAVFQTLCYDIPVTCNSVVSNIQFTELPGNDVQITFDSSGDATVWEWQFDGASVWTVIYAKSFIITFNELLQALITESGQEVVTENGEIIIPENIDPFAEQTIRIRPRCPNGAYGTDDTGTFQINPPIVCDPLINFSFNSKDYDAGTITLNIELPAGKTKFRLKSFFHYDAGFNTIPLFTEVDLGASIGTYVYNVPADLYGGSFVFSAFTNCSTIDELSYSAESNVVTEPWNPPQQVINIQLISIVEAGGNYVVTVGSSGVSTDDITVEGWFLGDAAGGTFSTFNFTLLILSGNLSGTANVPGAAPGGTATTHTFTNLSPDPTSDGFDLVPIY